MSKRVNQQILASILLFLASVGILLFDMKNNFKSQAPAIGIVEKEDQELKRRLKGDLEWNKITDKSDLYSEDRVFTSEKSNANISLADVLSIRLNELTLVKLNADPTQIGLDIGQGGVTLEVAGDEGTGSVAKSPFAQNKDAEHYWEKLSNDEKRGLINLNKRVEELVTEADLKKEDCLKSKTTITNLNQLHGLLSKDADDDVRRKTSCLFDMTSKAKLTKILENKNFSKYLELKYNLNPENAVTETKFFGFVLDGVKR